MTIDLAEWQAQKARLEAEERQLRDRIKAIEGQKHLMARARDSKIVDRVGDENVDESNDETNKSHGEDEIESAIPDIDASQVEQNVLSPPQEKEPLHLPHELVLQITSYVARGACSQQALATCCLVSRRWYDDSIALLYRRPRLYGGNFEPFVRAICPSINLHVRKSPLADLVRVLDMSQLVHQSSKTVTARVLGRTKERLEEFVAPQAGFSIHAFPPLAKCKSLRVLDLSLVAEAPPLPDLFKSVSQLTSLKTLRLPRSTGFGVHHKKSAFNSWPPNITNLTLSGGIDAHFLHGVASFPETLTHLTIEHCPLAKPHAITHLLKTAVAPLQHLQSIKIAHMSRLSFYALDEILFILPQISRLSVSVDYITKAIFDEGHFYHYPDKSEDRRPPLCHTNLRTLELTHSQSGNTTVQGWNSPIFVHCAMDDGALPYLRQVRVAQSLGWHTAEMAEQTEDLTDDLQEGARADWDAREWVFADMTREEYETERCWERVSGVWIFEG